MGEKDGVGGESKFKKRKKKFYRISLRGYRPAPSPGQDAFFPYPPLLCGVHTSGRIPGRIFPYL